MYQYAYKFKMILEIVNGFCDFSKTFKNKFQEPSHKKNKIMKKLIYFMFILSVLFVSCSKDDDEIGFGADNSGIIRDKNDAEDVAKWLAGEVASVGSSLSNGSYTDKVKTLENGGTVTISGSKTATDISAYTTKYKTNLTLVFNNYESMEGKSIVSGTIKYKLEDYLSSYSNYNFIKQIDGDNISISYQDDDYTIVDEVKIFLVDKDDNHFIVKGDLTSSDGTYYAINR